MGLFQNPVGFGTGFYYIRKQLLCKNYFFDVIESGGAFIN
jgi:hypothetical protein